MGKYRKINIIIFLSLLIVILPFIKASFGYDVINTPQAVTVNVYGDTANLSSLPDTNITGSQADSQVLAWDNTQQLWKPQAAGSVGDTNASGCPTATYLDGSGFCISISDFNSSSGDTNWSATVLNTRYNQTDRVNALNVSYAIQLLLNATNMFFGQVNSSQFCILDVCIGDWGSVNQSASGITNQSKGWDLNITRLWAGDFFTDANSFEWTVTDNGNDLIFDASSIGGTNSFFIQTAGTFMEMIANPGAGNDWEMFAFEESQGADTMINFYEEGTGRNRIWNSGSMRLGGETNSKCSNLTSVVDCDTPGTGADLVVEDDVWAGGTFFSNESVNASTINTSILCMGLDCISDWASVNGSSAGDTNWTRDQLEIDWNDTLIVNSVNQTIIDSNDSWLSTYNATYDTNVDSNWTRDQLEIDWNDTLIVNSVNQTIIDSNDSWLSTYNATYDTNVDTNESSRFDNLTSLNCPGTDKAIGVYANGTIECGTDSGGTDTNLSEWRGNLTDSTCAGSVVVGILPNGSLICETDDVGTGITNSTRGWTLNFTHIFSMDWLNVSILESQIKDLQDYVLPNEANRVTLVEANITDLSHTVDTTIQNASACPTATYLDGSGDCISITDFNSSGTDTNSTQPMYSINNSVNVNNATTNIEALDFTTGAHTVNTNLTLNYTQGSISQGNFTISETWFTTLWNRIFSTWTPDLAFTNQTNTFTADQNITGNLNVSGRIKAYNVSTNFLLVRNNLTINNSVFNDNGTHIIWD